MSALEQAIDESATVTVRWKDREFEVEASGMDDEEELVIAVSNKIHLAPEHLRLTWAVDGPGEPEAVSYTHLTLPTILHV